MQSVVIPLGRIDEDTLREFVDHLHKITNADIKVETQFVLTSTYPSVIDGLQRLMAVEPNGKITKAKARKVLAPPKGKQAPKQAWRTWTVTNPDGTIEPERLTKGEKTAMLKKGHFMTGTMLRHPKDGTFIVAGEPGKPQEIWQQ